MFNVGKQYDVAFRDILDVMDPAAHGWFSPVDHSSKDVVV